MRLALLHLRTRRPWDPDFQNALDDLSSGALAAAAELGFEAELVPCAEVDADQVRAVVARADAVVVLGGEDVHPKFYGGGLEYPGSARHEPGADAIQIEVVRDAAASGKPLLGICRGNQLLNVALGGTLVQHLPQADAHRGPGSGRTAFVSPGIALAGPAELGRDLGLDAGADAKLCSHHQAIDRLGGGLTVVARSDDGVIEAVVHTTAPITGVQWHPEHPEVALTQLTPLLRRLADQVASREAVRT